MTLGGTGATHTVVGYEYLVVATGLQSDWGRIPGLVEALEMGLEGGVCSNYRECFGWAIWLHVVH